jgi:hypothetical protein
MRTTLAGLSLCLGLVLGQVVEQRTSFDSRGELYRLSAEANAGAAVFPELSGFDHLEIWQTPEGPVLEVYRRDKTRERTSITEDELVHVRQQVDAYMTRPEPVKLDQEGRGSFLLQQIPLALGWYGPATTALLIPSADFRWQAALSMVVSSAGYFAPLSAMRNMKMTNAQAHLSVANGYRGVLAGYLIGHMFHISAYRAYSAIMMGTSIGGQIAGYSLADKLSLGQATLVTAYTDLGLMDGALLGASSLEWTRAENRYNISMSFWTLAGMATGSVAGNYLAPKWDCTEGQVTVLRTGVIVGAAVPTALYAAFASNMGPAAYILGIAGSAAGAWSTEGSIRDTRFSNGNGLIVTGMTIGGALLGSGVGVPTNTAQVIAVTGSAGAIVGLVGGIALAKNLQAGQASQGYIEPRIEFNYAGLVGGATSYAASRQFAVPNLVTVRF